MNLFQLVLKQMRQRALGSWLTMLSVMLGVALAVAILILRRESAAMFGQTDYGYDVLVGAKGSPLQLTLNTVYQIDKSPGNIPYSLYEEMLKNPQYRSAVKIAVPMAVGDSYRGLRIVGTSTKLFGFDEEGALLAPDKVFEYRPGRRYEIADGRLFHARKFEAVVGSDVPRLAGLNKDAVFQATHGMPAPNQTPDIHPEEWKVVGVLRPTHTAADRCLYIPLTTFYCVYEHEEALGDLAKIRAGADPSVVASGKAVRKKEDAAHDHPPATTLATASASKPVEDLHDEHDEHDDHAGHAAPSGSVPRPAEAHHGHDHAAKQYSVAPDGTITLSLPKDQWMVSAILVRSRGAFFGQQLMYVINNRNEASAVNPASVMRSFFSTFLDSGSTILLLISILVILVAGVGILVSIYNSVSARKREIAILRALGATRGRILLLICLEAGSIGLAGAILGIVGGHLLGATASIYMHNTLGEGINWASFSGEEVLYLIGVVALSTMAGLVPALKAYRTPVATNLVAG